MPKITRPLTSQLALKRCSTVLSHLIKTAIQNGLLHLRGWTIILTQANAAQKLKYYIYRKCQKRVRLGSEEHLSTDWYRAQQQNLTLTAATFSGWRLLLKFDYSRNSIHCRRHSNNKGQYEHSLSIYSHISMPIDVFDDDPVSKKCNYHFSH